MPVVAVYEDRVDALPGVRLLAYSLMQFAPELAFHVFTPHAFQLDDIASYDKISVFQRDDLVGRGTSVKPAIFKTVLEDHPAALWLDTDIVVSGDLTARLRSFSPDAFVISQDYRRVDRGGGRMRTDAYGLTFGEALPYAPNSGFTLIRRNHMAILEKWTELVTSDAYVTALKLPKSERPLAFLGDQQALWAVLSSTSRGDTPVEFLMTGPDQIFQSGANGYHLLDRCKSFFRPSPVIVHMAGPYQPWSFAGQPKSRKDQFQQLCYELGPYFEIAQHYSEQLSRPDYLTRRMKIAKFLNVLFLGNVALKGMPLSVLATLFAEKKR